MTGLVVIVMCDSNDNYNDNNDNFSNILMSSHNIRKSLKRFDVFTVAMGCFLLASKVEEKPKILREV